MLVAAINAECERPGWAEDALLFLREYARRHSKFSPEDVTDKAASFGLTARNLRSWGPVYRSAIREGLIEQTTEPYRRRFGHGSRGFLWRSKIFYPREQASLL